jgi:hypothetical protein
LVSYEKLIEPIDNDFPEFLDEGYIELGYLNIPIGVFVLSNIFFFLSTAWRIQKAQRDTSLVRRDKVTYK